MARRPRLSLVTILSVLTVFTSLPRTGHAQRNPCREVDCGGHGTCFVEQSRALCLCDRGYASLGTVCIETPEADVFRLRRAPGAGQRAADLAASQVGRRRSTLELESIGGVEPLGNYLSPDEWWCGDFVSWIYAAAGIPFSQGEAGGWLITNNLAIATWYMQHDLWVEPGTPEMLHYQPRPGDFIRIRTPSGGGHAGIIHHVEGTTLHVVEGNVSGEVMMSEFYFYGANRWILGFGISGLPNEAPHVEAPESVEALVGRPFVIESEGHDSGPESLLRYHWSVEAHEAELTLGVTDERTLSITCDVPGTYTLNVTLSDGELSDSSPVIVHASANAAPVVRARAADGRLIGEVDDDGVPSAATLAWTQVSGPATALIASPDRIESAIDLPTAGRYVFQLTADDGDQRADAEVTIDERGFLGCGIARRSRSLPALPMFVMAAAAIRRRRARNA